jgi:hypothetical protein
MKTRSKVLMFAAAAMTMLPNIASAQLHVGGYGEAAYSRNFYSDHVSRYSLADEHKDDPSHGRFDIPHAVVYLSYDFGKGWSMGSEIEFEHGGVGMAYEKEDEEGGEWEQEVEKGGEVELEQFWIQKSFAKWANIKAINNINKVSSSSIPLFTKLYIKNKANTTSKDAPKRNS